MASITNCRHSTGQIRGVNDVGYTCNQLSKVAIWLFTRNYMQTLFGFSEHFISNKNWKKIGGKYQHNMQSKIKKGYTEASYRKVSFPLLFGHFAWAYMSLGHFLFPYPVSCHLHSWCNDPSEEFPSYFSVFSFSPILTFSACAWVGDVNRNNSLLVAMPLRKMAALPQASFNWWGVASHESLHHPW